MIQMLDCIGILNLKEDDMHEKANWNERLIVSEWKSRKLYQIANAIGEGLGGVSANSQTHQNCLSYHLLTRGTRIIHLLSSWDIFKLGQMVLLAK